LAWQHNKKFEHFIQRFRIFLKNIIIYVKLFRHFEFLRKSFFIKVLFLLKTNKIIIKSLKVKKKLVLLIHNLEKQIGASQNIRKKRHFEFLENKIVPKKLYLF
jgi:hypothetical protein